MIAMPKKVTPLQKIIKCKWLYLMFLPVFLYYLLFRYFPMSGLIIAFKDYNIFTGIMDSPWAGLKYIRQFLNSMYLGRLVRNTLAISLFDLIFGFPAPIILALLLNEVRNQFFKRAIQTISYLPHFISTVVIVSMLVSFLSPSTGLINNIIKKMGGDPIHFLAGPSYFWGTYTMMNIWKGIGWGSIIYLASLAGIDPTLYEAAIIDGAGRWKQTLHITLPGISPTIIILLIIRIGGLIDVGYESIILMYTPKIYETADVIGSYVYRRGLVDADYSFATAVGMLQSVFGFLLVILSNAISRRFSETSLW